MIVADTSALAAIIFGEIDAPLFLQRLSLEKRVVIGAPTAFELRLVIRKRLGRSAWPEVDLLLSRPSIEITLFTSEHVAIAMDALVRFGGKPAGLNLGDCLSYAIAKAENVPLLFKGDDFTHTDLVRAI